MARPPGAASVLAALIQVFVQLRKRVADIVESGNAPRQQVRGKLQ